MRSWCDTSLALPLPVGLAEADELNWKYAADSEADGEALPEALADKLVVPPPPPPPGVRVAVGPAAPLGNTDWLADADADADALCD